MFQTQDQYPLTFIGVISPESSWLRWGSYNARDLSTWPATLSRGGYKITIRFYEIKSQDTI